ncbi:hypothetical protein Sjap_006602 [Stephania japonica]|uniref:Phytocyanin domain-containing protein n=1 Tax=Stephania japonica TaxID=461633 RepID=A0AAP0K7Q7_9MAGN
MSGNYYFICGAPGHCEAGQKVEIKVVPSSPSSSMIGASHPALSPSAFSPVPPHTSSAAVKYAANSKSFLIGLVGIALLSICIRCFKVVPSPWATRHCFVCCSCSLFSDQFDGRVWASSNQV